MKLTKVSLLALLVAGSGSSANALNIKHLRGSVKPEKELDLRRRLAEDAVDPVSYAATMKVGESVALEKTVTVGQEASSVAPVDVFFLADSTGSMWDEISAVQTSAAAILAATAPLGDLHYGVGEYKDITDIFIYRRNQDITADTAAVQSGINAWSASGGGDFYEANLYALHQVALTTTWRTDSTRILVWFGDAPGHDPRNGISKADAIGALTSANVVVQAIDVGRLNELDQAADIASATGGTLYSGVSTAAIVAKIEAAIIEVIDTYTTVRLRPPDDLTEVMVAINPAEGYTGEYTREEERDFDFTVTFTCVEEGVFSFDIVALVDDGLVATESDTITCNPANEPPEAICKDVSVPAQDPECNAVASIDNGSYDPDEVVTPIQDPAGPYELGETLVTLTVTDSFGEEATCTGTVTVFDVTPPTALCQDITIQLDAGGAAAISAEDIDYGSSDACGPVSLSISESDFGCEDLGEHSVTLTVTDGVGLTSICVSTVLVEDIDADGDGVLECSDECPGTGVPEGVPTQELKPNNSALTGKNGPDVFETAPPNGNGKGIDRIFTTEETGGCSCEQIINACGYGNGISKFGCPPGIMENWIDSRGCGGE